MSNKIGKNQFPELTYQIVKDRIEKKGFKLLSKEYVNNKTILTIKCPEGHINYKNLNEFENCKKCNAGSRFTIEEITEKIKEFGFELITKEYINARQKLDIKGKCGHIWNTTWVNFRTVKNKTCPICDPKWFNKEFIIEYANKRGYDIDESFIYKNPVSKIKITHRKCGNSFETSFHSFYYSNEGEGCLICSGRKWNDDMANDYVNEKGFKLLSKYSGGDPDHNFECGKGHKFKRGFSDFKLNPTCPVCLGSQESRLEIELFEIVKKKYKNTKRRVRIYSRYEFDIYLPDIKIGVEFNGDFFHANPRKFKSNDKILGKTKAIDLWKKDARKREILESMGYKIYYVWEMDYKKDRNKTIKKLFTFLENKFKIYERRNSK